MAGTSLQGTGGWSGEDMTMRTVRRVTVAGVLLLVFVYPCLLRGDEAEARAVQAIEKLGGKIRLDENSEGRPVFSVSLEFSKVTDAELKELVEFKQLRLLFLNATKVSDAGLKELAKLKQLQTLSLIGTKVTDAGMKELAKLEQLGCLDLSDSKITAAGVKELTALEQLTLLKISKTKVADAELAEIRKSLPKVKIER
jgi:hypothetical protein